MYEKELRGMAWSNIKNANVRNSVMKFASNKKEDGRYPTRSEIEKFRNARMALVRKSPNKVNRRRMMAEVEEL